MQKRIGELHVVTETVNGKKRILKVLSNNQEALEYIANEGATEKKFTDHGVVDREDVMKVLRSLEDE